MEASPASVRVLRGWRNSKLELVTKGTVTFQSEGDICLYRWHAELHLYPKVGLTVLGCPKDPAGSPPNPRVALVPILHRRDFRQLPAVPSSPGTGGPRGTLGETEA